MVEVYFRDFGHAFVKGNSISPAVRVVWRSSRHARRAPRLERQVSHFMLHDFFLRWPPWCWFPVERGNIFRMFLKLGLLRQPMSDVLGRDAIVIVVVPLCIHVQRVRRWSLRLLRILQLQSGSSNLTLGPGHLSMVTVTRCTVVTAGFISRGLLQESARAHSKRLHSRRC